MIDKEYLKYLVFNDYDEEFIILYIKDNSKSFSMFTDTVYATSCLIEIVKSNEYRLNRRRNKLQKIINKINVKSSKLTEQD